MSEEIQFGKIYKRKGSKGDPMDYAIPLEYNPGVLEPGERYIDISYVNNNTVGATSVRRFVEYYELI